MQVAPREIQPSAEKADHQTPDEVVNDPMPSPSRTVVRSTDVRTGQVPSSRTTDYALVKYRQVVLQIYALVKNHQVQVVLQIYAPVKVPIKKDVLQEVIVCQSTLRWRRILH